MNKTYLISLESPESVYVVEEKGVFRIFQCLKLPLCACHLLGSMPAAPDIPTHPSPCAHMHAHGRTHHTHTILPVHLRRLTQKPHMCTRPTDIPSHTQIHRYRTSTYSTHMPPHTAHTSH